MKTNRVWLAVCFALAFCLPAPLIADDPADDSSIMVDPGAPPPAFQKAPASTLSSAQRAQISERRQKETADRNWLMRGYAAELAKKQEEQDPSEREANRYRTADLNQASGLPLTSTDEVNRLLELGSAQDTHAVPKRDQEAAPEDRVKNSATLFKPFLSMDRSRAMQPMASPSPVFPPLVGPLTLDSGSAEADSAVPQLSARIRSGTEDPAAMDIPGMTAMENNPATREENELADADLLPGERRTEERPHHALQLELPVARTADRVQKMQDDALSVPGSTGQLARKTAVGAKAPTILAPINDTEQMVPHPSPLRTHVPDPYDILH